MNRERRQSEPSEDGLDALIRGHIAGELDRFVGSSARRFEQYIGPGPGEAPIDAPRRTGRPSNRSVTTRLWWSLPVLAAAAAVAMVMLPAMRLAWRTTSPLSPVVTGNNPHGSQAPEPGAALDNAPTVLASHDPQVRGALWWEYQDAGRVYLDQETVARRMLRTEYQRLEWTDPKDNVRFEVTVPRQEVVLVSSPRY